MHESLSLTHGQPGCWRSLDLNVEGYCVERPLAGYFKLQALPSSYLPWLAAILLGYAMLTTVMKRVYIRRFGWQ